MLTEIRETYDTKIIQLKELSSGGNDVKEEQLQNLQELNQALKDEIKALKENHTWLKKDNLFKTEQLNTFLADCGAKNQQLYELRKTLVSKESELKTKSENISSLNEQLI